VPYQSRPPGDPLSRLYASAAWKRCRVATLDRDDHQCIDCGAGANSVHHRPYGAIELLAMGEDTCDPAWCVSLCASCHGAADGVLTKNAIAARAPKANRFMTTVVRTRR
jgi:5-methylcytosine-specific restriction endonuclease McrA